MSRVYVVREGKVRGEGRYAGRKGTFCSGWGEMAHAWRFDRAYAKEYAASNGGRVVRLVTLSEQLRRERKRSNFLGNVAERSGCGSYSHCECCCASLRRSRGDCASSPPRAA